jgi:hypothetical protein
MCCTQLVGERLGPGITAVEQQHRGSACASVQRQVHGGDGMAQGHAHTTGAAAVSGAKTDSMGHGSDRDHGGTAAVVSRGFGGKSPLTHGARKKEPADSWAAKARGSGFCFFRRNFSRSLQGLYEY